MAVPKLRFGEFTDEWITSNLCEIADIVGGGTPDTFNETYWNGNIPWFTPTEIGAEKYIFKSKRTISEHGLKNSSAKILPKNTILLTSRATLGAMTILRNVATTNQGFQSLIIHDDFNYEFIYYYQPYIKKYCLTKSSGSTFLEISKSVLGKCKLSIPTLPEQEKIAAFLSLIDRKIVLQRRKVALLKDYKKGLQNELFNNKISSVEYHHQPLSALAARVTRKNINQTSNRPLTISAQYGLVDQSEFFNKTVASADITGYYLLERGEFAYNKSYSAGYPFGAIKRLDKYDNGVLSTLYICFKANSTVDSDFLVHYFETALWHKEIAMIAVEGARNHGLLNIAVSDFFDTIHYIPKNIVDQKHIATIITALDQKRRTAQSALDLLIRFKTGLLQEMFV